MVKVSIISLIYKSTKYLQFVYDQVHKYTDLKGTDTEFFFVTNDADPSVTKYLSDKSIPHYIFNNTPENVKAHGTTESYINNVYRAYNFGASKAQGKYLIFINSDMAFSPQWMENLFRGYDENRMCITSRLLESGRYTSGQHGMTFDCGRLLRSYQEAKFIAKAKELSKSELHPGGLFMPLLIKKSIFDSIGGYPEGNLTVDCTDLFNPTIAKKGKPSIPGDVVLMKKLKTVNVEHFTAFDSIVYHFQNGEMFE
jgi:glycosyl transferase family 2